jgi:hypothetical protein
MSFILDSYNREKQIATEDIPVFKELNGYMQSPSFGYRYKVGESNRNVDLQVEDGEIYEGYHSQRAPEPGYYRFVIPKGSEYYYTTNFSLQYVSSTVTLVSVRPLTEDECLEICNFPKTYEDACTRLGIKPVDEEIFNQSGLNKHLLFLGKLETVIKCINTQYGIEKYDWNNPNQRKWKGWFIMGESILLGGTVDQGVYAVTRGATVGFASSLCLPFKFAAQYVCSLNMEFFEYWKSYML